MLGQIGCGMDMWFKKVQSQLPVCSSVYGERKSCSMELYLSAQNFTQCSYQMRGKIHPTLLISLLLIFFLTVLGGYKTFVLSSLSPHPPFLTLSLCHSYVYFCPFLVGMVYISSYGKCPFSFYFYLPIKNSLLAIINHR